MELQRKLTDDGYSIPIIFVTGHGDVPMAVEAMKAGAIEFIQKPFREQELLDCIQSALRSASESAKAADEAMLLRKRIKQLTAREKQVMDLVVDGKPNKVIAAELGISQRTVENHRAQILEKIQVRTTAELIKVILSSSKSR